MKAEGGDFVRQPGVRMRSAPIQRDIVIENHGVGFFGASRTCAPPVSDCFQYHW